MARTQCWPCGGTGDLILTDGNGIVSGAPSYYVKVMCGECGGSGWIAKAVVPISGRWAVQGQSDTGRSTDRPHGHASQITRND